MPKEIARCAILGSIYSHTQSGIDDNGPEILIPSFNGMSMNRMVKGQAQTTKHSKRKIKIRDQSRASEKNYLSMPQSILEHDMSESEQAPYLPQQTFSKDQRSPPVELQEIDDSPEIELVDNFAYQNFRELTTNNGKSTSLIEQSNMGDLEQRDDKLVPQTMDEGELTREKVQTRSSS